MGLKAKSVVVILLLLTVVTIFVSPAVDLQPTALRALQAASLLLAALLLASTVLFAHLHLPISQAATFSSTTPSFRHPRTCLS